MKLNLYDKDLNRIAIIGEQFVSCLWSEGYNTVQPFTVEVQATPEYKKKFRTDYYLGRDDRKTLMVIKSVQIQGTVIVASGKQAARVLDDVSFIGTIAADSEVDTSIRNAYNSSNQYHNVEVAESALGVIYGSQISNKSILTLCTTMCLSEDVGFRTVRAGKRISVEFYKPELKPNLVFAERFGNLTLDSLTLSTENFKNYAIVLGTGEGENRTRADVDLTGGGERRDLIVDANDIQPEEGESDADYLARLRARGYEKLLEKQEIFKCAFTPIAKDFGTRYDLGDILTVLLPEYGLRLQARVAKFTQKTQKNKTLTTIEVGTIILSR